MIELLLKAVTYLNGVKELLKLAQRNQEITRIIQHYHRLSGSPITHAVIDQGQVVPEQQRKFNVIFVQGYYDSPTKSWCDGSASWLWPTKYLPASESHARVFFWDRQFKLTDFSSAEDVRRLGVKLLDFIRSTVHAPELSSKYGKATPLVFVSHSLGGLVVKAALAVQAAIDNRLDPGRHTSFSGRAKPRFARSDQAKEYSRLDLDSKGVCQDLHIKVLSITETFGQAINYFVQIMSFEKDYKSLSRLSCTDDVVYRNIVEFLHEILSEKPRQPMYRKKDIISALQNDPGGYTLDTLNITTSPLLKSLPSLPNKPVKCKISDWIDDPECPGSLDSGQCQ
ncbi:hypothetical protein J3459_008638 [Metarhizium acridum]|uniref:uncharacterized protein n=1 Tax=Metarhizium acridum TaxID=92637 RepID=UPI001C6B02A3|nr:hypothetical protein J3458_002690 [Metarhizium acridum]KAG8425944.1 hypothetical protein J3459_008638 [Metarhizium acridum]